jgi:hypothetical protein
MVIAAHRIRYLQLWRPELRLPQRTGGWASDLSLRAFV